MIEKYSVNIDVGANSYIPFNNTAVEKGCSATSNSPETIQLNKCGIYLVTVDCSAATSTTIQLYKDGVAQPQAQSTGTANSFTTLVQVDHNNGNCCCESPTILQVMNETALTGANANITIIKKC